MRKTAFHTRQLLVTAICLSLAPLAFAAAPEVSAEREAITVGSEAPAYTLRLSYPDGRVSERVLLAGESFAIDAASPGGLLADGVYQFDAQPITGLRERTGMDADAQIDKSVDAGMPTESGSFRVHQGRIVVADTEAAKQGDQDFGVRMKDQVINDDLIVTFSACIGNDCVNGENFGFDTVRLKENNTRLNFDDTSNSGSFPNNDWTLIANDSSNGGANYFAIEDRTAGRRVFEVRAGAPANSLFVDASGRIGIKTSTPVVNVHVADGNTPALRLEQNGSSGFTAQTWDIAGNETNFFVRDVTNGSRLPFKIKPGAATDSLVISNSGNIGFGTLTPTGSGFETRFIEVKGDKPALVLDNGGDVNQFSEVLFQSNNQNAWSFGTTTNDGRFYIYNYARNAYDLNISGTNGFVGLGGITNPTNPIQHSNGAVLTAAGVWQNASSRALKDEILELSADVAMDTLRALVPVTFRYKADPGDLNVGFIAEEVPDLVATASKKTLSSMDIVSVLTRVVQSQQQQIEKLAAEIEMLRSGKSSEPGLVDGVRDASAR